MNENLNNNHNNKSKLEFLNTFLTLDLYNKEEVKKFRDEFLKLKIIPNLKNLEIYEIFEHNKNKNIYLLKFIHKNIEIFLEDYLIEKYNIKRDDY